MYLWSQPLLKTYLLYHLYFLIIYKGVQIVCKALQIVFNAHNLHGLVHHLITPELNRHDKHFANFINEMNPDNAIAKTKQSDHSDLAVSW